jgi:branched-chain amino acid transport system permease protein
VVAAMGCGLAGAMIAANTLRVQPTAMFSVNYAVFMIFIVVIGGLGTIEGPILGAIVFFAMQQWLSGLGVWYLVILGVLAILMTLFLPRGLWGVISGNGRFRLFPVGYRVTSASALLGTSPADVPPADGADGPAPAGA